MNVHIVAASTTQSYTEESFPGQGWGHYLQGHFSSEVRVLNHAVAGWSLKNFLYAPAYIQGTARYNEPEKSRWAEILRGVEPGDYVIIGGTDANDMLQTGKDRYEPSDCGNYVLDDNHVLPNMYIRVPVGLGTHRFFTLTSTPEESGTLLEKMFEQVSARGATPLMLVLTGKYYRIHGDEHRVFSVTEAYKRQALLTAERCGVEVLNVYDEVTPLIEKMGWLAYFDEYGMTPHSYEFYRTQGVVTRSAPKFIDNVHFNVKGAAMICDTVVELIRKTGCEPLKAKLL